MRVIIERLVRRLDYETVAEHIPEGDRKLLTHIRKEQQRKQRKGGQSEEGSQVLTILLVFQRPGWAKDLKYA